MNNLYEYRQKNAGRGVSPTMSLFDFVHRLKTLTTKRYIDGVKQHGWIPFPEKLWQRNYYEHIIRDEKSYLNISEYIINNPMSWQEDQCYEQSALSTPGQAGYAVGNRQVNRGKDGN